MRPNNIKIQASYSKRDKDKTYFVSFDMNDEQKVLINMSVTDKNGGGTFYVREEELAVVDKFRAEALAAFKQLVTLNTSFAAAQPQEEKESA